MRLHRWNERRLIDRPMWRLCPKHHLFYIWWLIQFDHENELLQNATKSRPLTFAKNLRFYKSLFLSTQIIIKFVVCKNWHSKKKKIRNHDKIETYIVTRTNECIIYIHRKFSLIFIDNGSSDSSLSRRMSRHPFGRNGKWSKKWVSKASIYQRRVSYSSRSLHLPQDV